jgi:hypothetical protein
MQPDAGGAFSRLFPQHRRRDGNRILVHFQKIPAEFLQLTRVPARA